jgi:hypothetical protein
MQREHAGLLPSHLTFFLRQITHAKVTLTRLGLSVVDFVVAFVIHQSNNVSGRGREKREGEKNYLRE